MRRRASRLRIMVVAFATRDMAEPDTGSDAVRSCSAPSKCTDEWLSEEEMPDRNVDGTPMVNGVDLNGRPYGRCAAWEDDPWDVDAVHRDRSDSVGAPAGLVRDTAVPASDAFCGMCFVIVDGRIRQARHHVHGSRPTRSHARFHRSMSSRRARRWRREEAATHGRFKCWWFTLFGEALRPGNYGTASKESHQ